ncbi:ribosome assembly cofactor RimP [Puteibacter caeruleilacunae]|nr:ribosome assembly cofactor RimP [Puteibacter caeruleilacunae]
MIDRKYILKLLEEKMVDGLFLVDLSISSNNHITVVIDGDNGVPISKCVEVSRQVEHNLDREEADFHLDVLTAGLGEAFKLKRQYYKNINREIEVIDNSGEKFVGMLKEVDEEGIQLEYSIRERIEGKKKKQTVVIEKELKFDEIKTAKNVISFK